MPTSRWGGRTPGAEPATIVATGHEEGATSQRGGPFFTPAGAAHPAAATPASRASTSLGIVEAGVEHSATRTAPGIGTV